MTASLILPMSLREQLVREAREAFPRECCGLIEGWRNDDVARATALHPTRNLSKDDNRFEIDPTEQIRLVRNVREKHTEIIGCYHSHPNGRAEPSERDREGAGEEGFLWLIASLSDKNQPAVLRAFSYSASAFASVSVVSEDSLDRLTAPTV